MDIGNNLSTNNTQEIGLQRVGMQIMDWAYSEQKKIAQSANITIFDKVFAFWNWDATLEKQKKFLEILPNITKAKAIVEDCFSNPQFSIFQNSIYQPQIELLKENANKVFKDVENLAFIRVDDPCINPNKWLCAYNNWNEVHERQKNINIIPPIRRKLEQYGKMCSSTRDLQESERKWQHTVEVNKINKIANICMSISLITAGLFTIYDGIRTSGAFGKKLQSKQHRILKIASGISMISLGVIVGL